MGQTRLCTKTPLCLMPRVHLRRTTITPTLKRQTHLSSTKTSRTVDVATEDSGQGVAMRTCGVLALGHLSLSKTLNNTTRGLDRSCFISCYSSDFEKKKKMYVIYMAHPAMRLGLAPGSCPK